jgi:hypothetical protein
MAFLRRLKVERCIKCARVATEEIVTTKGVRVGVYCNRCWMTGLHERLDLEREAAKRGIKLKP